MPRNLQIGVLSFLAILFASLFLLDAAWFFHGSLELFPTDEQQGKIDSTALLAGCGFVLAGTAALLLLRRLIRNRHRPCSDVPPSPIDGSHP